MPTVQYIYNGETHTRNMPTPKKVTSIQHWYKEARKALSAIPQAVHNVFGDNEWMIEHFEIDVKWIKYDLINRQGRKAYLVILRKS